IAARRPGSPAHTQRRTDPEVAPAAPAADPVAAGGDARADRVPVVGADAGQDRRPPGEASPWARGARRRDNGSHMTIAHVPPSGLVDRRGECAALDRLVE